MSDLPPSGGTPTPPTGQAPVLSTRDSYLVLSFDAREVVGPLFGLVVAGIPLIDLLLRRSTAVAVDFQPLIQRLVQTTSVVRGWRDIADTLRTDLVATRESLAAAQSDDAAVVQGIAALDATIATLETSAAEVGTALVAGTPAEGQEPASPPTPTPDAGGTTDTPPTDAAPVPATDAGTTPATDPAATPDAGTAPVPTPDGGTPAV